MGLTNTTAEAIGKPTTMPRAKDIIVFALWLGAATGLVEGGLFPVLLELSWRSWTMQQWSVFSKIVWISTALNVLLFLAVGLFVLLLRCWLPRLGLLRWSVFLFVWLACFDWLAISHRIHPFSAFVLAAGLASVAMRWFSRHEPSVVRFANRTLPWVLATALCAFTVIEGGFRLKERIATAHLPVPSSGSPNVLVIVIDTLRSDHMSAYGYARATSPNLDRIAREGVLFEKAFAASSWTLPSHASLLTGRYLHEHGAGLNYYNGRDPNIAQALLAEGYRTGAFSANTYFFCRTVGFGAGFLHFEDYFGSWADMASHTFYGHEFFRFVSGPLGYQESIGRKQAQAVNREFFRWVDRTPGKPFFAFLNYFDVHDPYQPPQPYRNRFTSLKNPGRFINEFVTDSVPHLTPEQWQGEKDAYDGAIAYVDEQIGELFSDLKARGLAENTLVVITSDHGEEFGDHGLILHGMSLYRQEIQVPLIFWWPGKLPAGVRLGTPVTNVAVPATIMDLVARGKPSAFPGPSLVQLWKTQAIGSDWPEPLVELAQRPYPLFKKYSIYYGGMKSLIIGHWQYIDQDKSGEELYDWEKDPEELHNLAATPEGQRINREFRRRLGRLVGDAVGINEGDLPNHAEGSNLSGARRSPSAGQPR
jgi:arylsulfatase A-like enzyme